MGTLSFNTPPALVMVVDDDDFSRALMCEMLTQQGVQQVVTACNGRDALTQMEDQHLTPDCMVCDVFMPDMDGIELMHAMAQRRYQGGVILLSGGSTELLSLASDIAQAQGIHMLGAFVKPMHQHTLAAALGRRAVTC